VTGQDAAVIVGRETAHCQWTEIEARGVLEAWKKSGQTLQG
jgi:hypothetical protein